MAATRINRQYSSDVGSFKQPDPVSGRVGNPQSFNRYEYAMGDPVNFTDPPFRLAGIRPSLIATKGICKFRLAINERGKAPRIGSNL
jgi:hypothetical protein